MPDPADISGAEFLIEEIDTADGSEPIVLRLRGRDRPLGGRGSGGAFDITPKVRQSEHFKPGSDEPTRHVMGTRYEPLQIHGNLQDRFFEKGHARAVSRTMEALATRKRRLRISWATWTFLGLLDSAKLSPETVADINYELVLHIDGPAEAEGSVPFAAAVPPSPADLVPVAADLGTQLAAAADRLANPLVERILGLARVALTTALLAAQESTVDLVSVISTLDNRLLLSQADASLALIAATAVQSAGQQLRLVLEAIALPEDDGPHDWQTVLAVQRTRTELLEATAQLDVLAQHTQEALWTQAVGTAGEVYFATDGDTLETVAQTRLGDGGRAGEIARLNGLATFRLVSGQRLALPARS